MMQIALCISLANSAGVLNRHANIAANDNSSREQELFEKCVQRELDGGSRT